MKKRAYEMSDEVGSLSLQMQVNGRAEKTIFGEDGLTGLRIVPYRRELVRIEGSEGQLTTACMIINNRENGGARKIPVVLDLTGRIIYIEEKNFNCHWKLLKNAIFQEMQRLFYFRKFPEPVYSELKNRVDLSLYETENRRAVLDNNRIRLVGKPVSEEARRLAGRRTSVMDNQKILYVCSASDNIVHDKACPLVRKIPDRDFLGAESLPKDRLLCTVCTRMMYIRKGCREDFKNYGLYSRFFQRASIDTKEIGRLVEDFEAVFRMEGQDTLWIRCREDQWKILLDGEDHVTLLHNNYVMVSDEERYISGGFHDQNLPEGSTAFSALRYLEKYTWDGHLAAKALKEAQEADAGIPATQVVLDADGKAGEKTLPWLSGILRRMKAFLENITKF